MYPSLPRERSLVSFMTDSNYIACEVTKSFAGKTVLNKISFQLRKGELLLVTGNNGSGKTTLLKLLAGIYKADSGQLEMRGDVSYYGTDLYLYGPMSVAENLEYFAALCGISKEKVNQSIELWELSEVLGSQVRSLSSGQKCKVSIARACLQQAQIYLFDEPLRMLDQKGRNAFITQLNALTADSSVIVTTHQANFFEALSSSIIKL